MTHLYDSRGYPLRYWRHEWPSEWPPNGLYGIGGTGLVDELE